MIAYQLDAQHNKLPAFWNVPYAPPTKYAADYQEPERVKGPFDLPDGVRLASADEQNLLFVTGANAAQIAHLQELVDILDQPLRLVEIEAQLVELPVAELKEFGIEFNGATPDAPKTQTPIKGMSQFGFLRNNFQKRLDEMVAAGTATVVSTAPLTLTNNMGQAISLRTGPIDNTGANQYKMPAAPAEGTDTILTLTPTINGDDTITVLMNIATLPANDESPGLTTIANLRDGDTIALSGLESSAFPRETTPKARKVPLLGDIPIFAGGLFRTKEPKDERVTLLFVSARIVRDDAK